MPIQLGGAIQGVASGRLFAAALGMPYVLAQSAVAVNNTGNTTENTVATITVPANAMGANGRIRITTLWTCTNSANNKFCRVRVGGGAGTQILTATLTTVASLREQSEWANRNATNSQITFPAAHQTATFNTSTGANLATAVDTTAQFTIVLTAQLASAGETITLESYLAELIYGA